MRRSTLGSLSRMRLSIFATVEIPPFGKGGSGGDFEVESFGQIPLDPPFPKGAVGLERLSTRRSTASSGRGKSEASRGAGWRRPGCALVSILLLVAASCASPQESAPAEAAPPVRVRATRVRRGEVASYLDTTGETAALDVVRLASPAAGRITSLSLRPGDRARAGEVVARVLPLESEAALHGFSMLDEAGGLRDEGRDVARRLRRDLRGRDIPLRAPFPAVVSARPRNPGEQVAAGDEVLELFDPRSLYVVAHVPVERAGDVRPGLPVEVRVGAVAVPGQVQVVLSAVTRGALTVPVRIDLKAPLEPPLLDAAASCRIRLAVHPNALIVPLSALVSSTVESRGTVVVVRGRRSQRRAVTLGLRTAEEVEVIGGLADGDVVLTGGQYALPDGTLVEAQLD
jgi:multidrug efflux pump subunit AcrA (membrane-fusion protein)